MRSDSALTMAELRQANPQWFSRGNKRFFGDVSYCIRVGKATGERYLVRSTYAWTDMFGRPRTLHYRVNRINDDRSLGSLVDTVFASLSDLRAWLKEH